MAQNLNLLTFLGQKFKDLVHELSHQAVSKYFWKDLLIVMMLQIPMSPPVVTRCG